MLDRTKVLENHTANTGGGGEGHRGAGIYAENSTVYLINSLIAGNFIEDSKGEVTIAVLLYMPLIQN